MKSILLALALAFALTAAIVPAFTTSVALADCGN